MGCLFLHGGYATLHGFVKGVCSFHRRFAEDLLEDLTLNT